MCNQITLINHQRVSCHVARRGHSLTRRLTTRESNHRDRPSRPRPVPSRMRACPEPEPECAPGRPAGQYPTRGRHRPTARLNPIISIAKSQKEVRCDGGREKASCAEAVRHSARRVHSLSIASRFARLRFSIRVDCSNRETRRRGDAGIQTRGIISRTQEVDVRCIFWYCRRTPSIDTAAETQVRSSRRDGNTTQELFDTGKAFKSLQEYQENWNCAALEQNIRGCSRTIAPRGIAGGQKPNRVMSQCRVFHTALGVPPPIGSDCRAVRRRCFSVLRQSAESKIREKHEPSGAERSGLDSTGPVWTGVERRATANAN